MKILRCTAEDSVTHVCCCSASRRPAPAAVPPAAATAMRMYEAQHSRDMKGRRPTAGENMKLALARVKVVGDRHSFVLPFVASSAAPTAKGVGAGDQDADSRHHSFLLASAKGMGAGDRDAGSRHHRTMASSSPPRRAWARAIGRFMRRRPGRFRMSVFLFR